MQDTENQSKMWTSKHLLKKFPTGKWETVVLLTAVLLAIGVAIYFLVLAPPPDQEDGATGVAMFVWPYGEPTYGKTSMEEVIAHSDIIVKAEFVSVTAFSVEKSWAGVVSGLRYQFRVLEYLAGTGSKDIYAEVEFSCPCWDSKKDAEIHAKRVIKISDPWHGREMVIFLKKPEPGYSSWSAESNVFQFAGPDPINQSRFLITSRENKAWLPAAVSSDGASGTAAGDEQLFLTDWPSESSSSAEAAASAPTIKLGGIKKLIATIETEISGYETREIGRECVQRDYSLPRFKKWNIDPQTETTTEFNLVSGQRADTELVRAAFGGGGDGPRSYYSVYFLTGEVGKLFVSEIIDNDGSSHQYQLAIKNSRPIPKGTYSAYLQMVPDFESASQDPCFDLTGISNLEELKDIQPQVSKDIWVIDVDAPAGTLHEAFFDPVALTNPSDGIGVRYSPKTSFTLPDKTSVTLDYLYYAPGIVKMGTTPHNALSGYEMDIIELDGKVSSTFAFGGSGSTSAPHEWATCVQPWDVGDKLMLRIRETGTGSASASSIAPCPTYTPTPTPTNTPTPTATPTETPTSTPTPVPGGVVVTATRNSDGTSVDVSWTKFTLRGFNYYRFVVCRGADYDGASCRNNVYSGEPIYKVDSLGPVTVKGLESNTSYNVIMQVWYNNSSSVHKYHAAIPAVE